MAASTVSLARNNFLLGPGRVAPATPLAALFRRTSFSVTDFQVPMNRVAPGVFRFVSLRAAFSHGETARAFVIDLVRANVLFHVVELAHEIADLAFADVGQGERHGNRDGCFVVAFVWDEIFLLYV